MTPTDPTDGITLERLSAIIAKYEAREEMGIGSAEFGEILRLARLALTMPVKCSACEDGVRYNHGNDLGHECQDCDGTGFITRTESGGT